MIDCETQKVIEKWNGITEFASAFELVDNTIINHVTRKSCEIKEENYRIKIASSTSQYLLITNEYEGENKLIIYDDKQSYLVNLQSLFQ